MVRIGLLGAGTVGTAFANLLTRSKKFKLSKALVRDIQKPRAAILSDQLSLDAKLVLEQADILVEVMGGVELAGDLMLEALHTGKPVITANKAVLAERWDEFKEFIQKGKLYFEAAVMAGTPVIGPISQALRGSRPLALHAILNGTCNYILSQLEAGVAYEEALSEAQRLGYAEADPSLDVDGFDAAHKLTVLAKMCVDPNVTWSTIKANTQGISQLEPRQVQAAMKRGKRIRLLGSVYPDKAEWKMQVRPVLLPETHPLAGVDSQYNALYFQGDALGDLLIVGAGAGGIATASGVFSDVLAASQGRPGPSLLQEAASVPIDAPQVFEDAL